MSRIRWKSRAASLGVVFGLLSSIAPSPFSAQQTAPETRRVGTMDIFGYSGWEGDDPDTAAVRQKLAARVGAEVRLSATAAFRRQVQGDVVAVTGKPATDVAVICCNDKGDLSVFVGIEGKESIPLEQRGTPTGADALPPEALALCESTDKALQAADARGDSAEDESHGYDLAHDSAAHALQEQMHTFAASHVEVILRVLRRSGAVQQRRAAAYLLGYGDRSTAQVRALQDAMNDDDEGVRNNAVRALAAMASSGPVPGMNAVQIVGLLYSGIWTDRNKGSALLLGLTARPDPKLLKTLVEQALPPLIEDAQWQSKPHAFAFAMVLARVLGMPDDRSSALINGGHVSEIIQQAKALENRGNKR